jgi:hypothetical protein
MVDMGHGGNTNMGVNTWLLFGKYAEQSSLLIFGGEES